MIRRSKRSGFTLIELLVVISIIVLLAALTTTAVFRVRAAQQKSYSETALNKVDTLLQRKIKTIQEQINEDAKYNRAEWSTVLANCGGNSDVAKAVMLYARTKQQLPMTIAEGKSSFTVAGHVYPPNPIFTAQAANADVSPDCSAVCLYLALLPLGIDGLEQQIGDSIAIPGGKCFKDSYGAPIAFNRLAYVGNQGELNAPPYIVAGQAHDPYYNAKTPAGAFRNLAVDFPGGAAAFQTSVWNGIVSNTPAWAGIPAAFPGLTNHTSTAISAGQNKNFFDPGIYDGDNLLSFRLRREGTRGD